MKLLDEQIQRIEELVTLHMQLSRESTTLLLLMSPSEFLQPNFGRTPETREAAALFRKHGREYRAICKQQKELKSKIADCALWGL